MIDRDHIGDRDRILNSTALFPQTLPPLCPGQLQVTEQQEISYSALLMLLETTIFILLCFKEEIFQAIYCLKHMLDVY